MNEVEAVARAIAPSRWEVMDHYLAQTKRKYDGENAAYDPDQFKDRESMVTAQAAIAALDAARGDAEPVAWMPIETAPKDGTAFQAIIPGHGADNVLCWTDGLIGSDGRDCGSWVFASDQEPPDCWTDGYCWEVNEDGVPSVQPTHWKPLLPPRGDQVARVVEFIREQQVNADKYMRDAAHRKTESHFATAFVTLRNLADAIERGEPFHD